MVLNFEDDLFFGFLVFVSKSATKQLVVAWVSG